MRNMLRRFDQIAYVTNDLDRAFDLLETRYGIGPFSIREIEIDGHMYDERGLFRLSVCVAMVDELRIEIIRPHADIGGLYSSYLPANGSFRLAFHHIGTMVLGDECCWRERLAVLTSQGGIAFSGNLGPEIQFVYTDERAVLGHYVEHFWMSAPMIAKMAATGLMPTSLVADNAGLHP